MSDERADRQREEELFERLLAPSPEQQPSAEQLRRWATRFSAELQAARRRRYARRFGAAAVACASAVALTLVLTSGLTPTRTAPADGDVVAHVVKSFGGNVVREDGQVVRVPELGGALRAGDLVESGLRSGLGVIYRNADVRLDAETSVIFHSDRLELRQGRIYIDVPALAGSAPAGPIRVDTPLGTFAHLGTQFLVSVTDAGVSGAVREGAITLRSGGRELRLVAADAGARRVVVDRPGRFRESDVPASGPLWAWASRSAPGIVVTGRSPQDVLLWAARERGQRLVYLDAAAGRVARDTRLAGSAVEMTVEQALAAVDGTTRLHVDASGAAVLEVEMDSEGDQKPD